MPSFDYPIGLFITDEALVLRSWDDWLAHVTGISASEARGQPLTALVPDLEARGLLARFKRVLGEGVVELLAPAFHHYLIACPPSAPSPNFEKMQQRVTIAPLREEEHIVGTIVTIEDVTARLDHERALAAQLASDDEATRLRAAEGLAEAESLEGATVLTEAIGDESWRVRRVVVEGLARQGGADVIETLLRALHDNHRNPSVLNSALQVLALLEENVVERLIEFLAAPDPELRAYVALALGEQQNPAAIPALLQTLADPDINVRYHAIEALGQLRALEAVEPLMALAERDEFYLAFPALDALARLGDPSVAPRIVPLLASEWLRTPAAAALGELGNESAIAPLVELLNTTGSPVLTVVEALVSIYERYEILYREGQFIADQVRAAIDGRGIQHLLAALDYARPDELRPLVVVLGWLEGPATQRALARLLHQPAVHNEVIRALSRQGARVIDLLIEQLDTVEIEPRQAVALTLGRIGDPRAVPALIRLLGAEPEVVIVAVGALAKIADRSAFESLLALIGHPHAAVRQASISALNSLGHPEMALRVAALMEEDNPRLRESATKIAGYFGYPECVELMLRRCQDQDEGVRRAAVEHLPFLEDERCTPALLTALAQDSPAVRAAAAHALAHMEEEVALPALLRTLQEDEDAWVRYHAARSLGRHGSPATIDPLGRVSREPQAMPVRLAAIEALGRIGGSRAVAYLAPFVEAEDRDLVRAALKALGMMGHPDALPPLLTALRSPDAGQRRDAVQALGERGGSDAVPALHSVAARDPDEQVVQEAVDALARLASAEAVAALIELSLKVPYQARVVTALANLGDEQVPWVAQGLEHPHPGVREAVVVALARMKRGAAVERLSRALDDEESAVRLAAVKALAQLGSRRATSQLEAMATHDPDPAVRRLAQWALQR